LDTAYSKGMLRRRVGRVALIAAALVIYSTLGSGASAASAAGATAASAAGAAVPPALSVKPSPQCTSTHRVLPNDSWTRLAARFKVPQGRLLRLNSASLTTPLFIGDTVCLAVRSTSASGGGAAGSTGGAARTSATTTTTIAPTSTTTSTTTTTTTVATPTAPTVTVAEPVACRPIQVSWRGASPDTGLYSLQWVRVSAAGTYDFREYTMWNVRGTSTAMPNWLAHGATYALRIYAMRADWDGLTHSNQNVTPHSAIVTFTLPSCNQPATTTTTTTTTTTVAPTTYSVTYNGNTNGSGSVPVDATAYASGATVTVAGNTGTLAKTGYTFDGWCTTQPAAGAACTGTSRAAASTFAITTNTTLYAVWTGTTCATGAACIVGDTGPGGGIVFYVHTGGGTFSCGVALTSTCRYLEAAPADVAGTHAWCSNTSSPLSVTATGIGAGMANTTTADTTCSSGAIQQAADYTNNGKSDWHLPSRDELNQLYLQRFTVGGFATVTFWSSSEHSATRAWDLDFFNGIQYNDPKEYNYQVRPVRAFGGTLGCADGGTCVVGDTGPGGGTVFYVHSGGGTFSCGVALVSTCRYLEVAPADIAGTHAWCSNTSSLLNATYTAIGAGMENTTTADPMCTTGAIRQAADYTNNGRSDWYLPSKDELNELCKYAKNTGQAAGGATLCSGGADAAVRGFTATNYWSSSEDSGTTAWQHSFFDGSRGANSKWHALNNVRVVRAFG
jgi:hypothetical protein